MRRKTKTTATTISKCHFFQFILFVFSFFLRTIVLVIFFLSNHILWKISIQNPNIDIKKPQPKLLLCACLSFFLLNLSMIEFSNARLNNLITINDRVMMMMIRQENVSRFLLLLFARVNRKIDGRDCALKISIGCF